MSQQEKGVVSQSKNILEHDREANLSFIIPTHAFSHKLRLNLLHFERSLMSKPDRRKLVVPRRKGSTPAATEMSVRKN